MVKRIRFMTCLFYHNKEKWKEKKKDSEFTSEISRKGSHHPSAMSGHRRCIGKGHLDFSSFRNKQNETK